MNRIYRLIWSETAGAWVAIAETASGRGKGSSKNLVVAALSLTAAFAQATPIGGQVVTGTGSITQSGLTTTIQQSSQSLSLNWTSFNVTAQQTVNFVQPSALAIAVNRIFDTSPSQIFGRLNANGQVYLINPNGMLFGQSAQVNVGGLAASTLGLNNTSLTSNTRTFSGTGSGSIVNQGTINAASGGYVALLGNTVKNQGSITAPLGAVALGAGNAVTLTFSNNSLAKMQVDQSVLNSFVENGGLIRANGGMVIMNAGAKSALLTSVVNNTGVIEARTLENRNGTITLLAGMKAGTVNVGGKLDASAPSGGTGSNGGFIETSAAHVKVANGTQVTTAAPKGKTGTWLIDPVDFTVSEGSASLTSSGIGASTLSSNLNGSTNVSIATDPSTTGNGDIFINAPVSWSANKLTLSAIRNINVNANLNVSGAASLDLQYGQGALAASNTSSIITTGAAVNLPAGTNNFTTKQGSDGLVNKFTVISSLGAAGSISAADLQGMSGNATLNYALGSNIEAAQTSGWGSGKGFTPIVGFTGTFDGLGHTINNLTINRPGIASIGLFGTASAASVIQNVGLVGGSTIGAAGTGSLLGSGSGSTINNSYATGNVSGAAGTGGLVGSNTTGSISNSYSSGSVSGGAAAGIGGLVGSLTTGNIFNSYATGNVTGGAGTGGLIGNNTTGNITNSYASGNASGGAGVGGLLGTGTTGAINNSYAVGDVFGAAGRGGLVGVNTTGVITNSYATGNVGGAGASAGGLIGSTSALHVGSFWDITSTGQTTSLGGVGVVGMSTADMKLQSNFTSATAANGNVNPGWDYTNTWLMANGSYPLLKSFVTYSIVKANDTSVTYSGQAGGGYAGGGGVTYSGNLKGTLSYSGTSQGAKNVGNYVITPGGLSAINQQQVLTFVSGALAITPANLVVKGLSVNNKVYDATTVASLSGTATVTALGIDSVTLGGAVNGTFAIKDVGTRAVTLVGNTLSGADAGNYTLVQQTGLSGVITPANLTLSSSTISKVYDGGLAPAIGAIATVVGGTLFSGDTLSGGTFAFTDKNVGTNNKAVTARGITVNDGNSGSNYSVSYANNYMSTISQANLVLSSSTINKIYDGGVSAQSTAVISSGRLFADDSLSGGTFAFSDKNAGIGNKTVMTTGVKAGSGAYYNNYAISYVNNTANTIKQAALSLTTSSVIKTYDGDRTALGTAVVVAGKLFGGDVLGGGTFMFTDKNSGIGSKTVVTSGVSINDSNSGDNYLVKYVNNTTSTIRQANLSLRSTNVSKTYDGDLSALGTAFVTGGTLFGTDTLSGGIFAFTNKNAGLGSKIVTMRGVTVGDGINNKNYVVSYDNNLTSTINKAELTLSSASVSKTYDGALIAQGRAVVTSGRLFSGDSLSGGTFAFIDKTAGSNKTVTTTGVKVGDGINNGNYAITYVNNTTSTISQASP